MFMANERSDNMTKISPCLQFLRELGLTKY